MDADRLARIGGRTPGVDHPVVADRRPGALDADAGRRIAIQAVVFDAMAAAVDQADADLEAADIAVADGAVQAAVRGDARGHGAGPRGQAAQLEVVAVERDVVGGDGDGHATAEGGAQVMAQAPGALGADQGGQGVDEPRAVVVAPGGTGREWQGRTEDRGGRQDEGDEAMCRAFHPEALHH